MLRSWVLNTSGRVGSGASLDVTVVSGSIGVVTALGIGSPSAGFNCFLRDSASFQHRAPMPKWSECPTGHTCRTRWGTVRVWGGARASTTWPEGERELNGHLLCTIPLG